MFHHRRSGVGHTQNFLHSSRLVERIVDLAQIRRDDLVIEIGPDRGIITDALIRRSNHVMAIEKDVRYVDELTRRYADCPHVTVFATDVLDFPLPATPYMVFASIPYDITTAIVSKLTSGISPPVDAYLIMQREAADRFRGQPSETLISLGVEPWFETRVVHIFRRSDFRPAPAVDSVLFHIARRDEPLIPVELGDRYRNLIAAIFSAWKPTAEAALGEFLSAGTLKRTEQQFGESLRCKPSLLPFERWIELFATLTEIGDERLWSSFAGAHARLRQQQGNLHKQHRSRTGGRASRGQRPQHDATRR